MELAKSMGFKAEELKKLAKKLQADVIIFDHDMSPNQLRDLEEIINRKILDRSELILDIFATRARTATDQSVDIEFLE